MAKNFSLLIMIVIMVSTNVGFGLWDNGVVSYNPDYVSGIDYSSTPVATMTIGGNLSSDLIIDTSFAVPESADSVDADTGNIFTDIYKSVTGWATRVDSKYTMVTGVLHEPARTLKNIGVPVIYANSFGLIWYAVLLFLLVSFFKGGGAD